MKIKPATLYILRHAESQGSVNAKKGIEQKISNALESDLSPNGILQAEKIAKKFFRVHFDAIFSSHLLRAHRTAKIISKERNLEVITKEALRERIKGTLNGKSELQIRTELGDLYGNPQILTHEEMLKFKMFNDMESAEEAISRFITIIREIAITYPGKKILVVTHGNMIRLLLIHLGYATFSQLPSGSIQNTGYIILNCDGVELEIVKTYGVKP